MTSNEFILWLKSYVELSATSSLSANTIKQKLNEVDLNNTYLSISPSYPFEHIYATGKEEMDKYIKEHQVKNGFNDITC